MSSFFSVSPQLVRPSLKKTLDTIWERRIQGGEVAEVEEGEQVHRQPVEEVWEEGGEVPGQQVEDEEEEEEGGVGRPGVEAANPETPLTPPATQEAYAVG